MRKKTLVIFSLTLVAGLFVWLSSCKKEQNTSGLTLLQQEIPEGFPQPVYRFEDNPLSQEGFELGRKLFYDERLSIDNLHPCSSCHQQIGAFGTYEHDRSHGVFDSHTLRNAPALFNLAWQPAHHWDGEFVSLTDAIAQPIHGSVEMGETFEGIINKIKDDKDYQERFRKVFRSPFIQPEHILKALAQFTGMLISYDSKYDRYKKGTATFSAQEQNGYQLYKTYCASCHPEPLFTDFSIRNIGLPADNTLKDYGRMRVTGKKEDSLKFRVPTLRNTYLSANYMHDGRFNTLGQVINHYRTGVQQSPTLDPLLTNGITLTNTQANELFTFLRALTDSSILRDTRFSKPR